MEALRAESVRLHLGKFITHGLTQRSGNLSPPESNTQQQLISAANEKLHSTIVIRANRERAPRCQYNSRPNLSREQIHLSPLDAFFRRHSSSKRRTWFASPPSGVRSAGAPKAFLADRNSTKFPTFFPLSPWERPPPVGAHFRLIDCKMDRVVPCQELRCKLRQ